MSLFGYCLLIFFFFFFKQKTAYEMRISDWSSDVCSSDLFLGPGLGFAEAVATFGGRVLATGSTAEIAGLAGPGTTRIDLAGRLAVPGLNDAHPHMMSVEIGKAHV